MSPPATEKIFQDVERFISDSRKLLKEGAVMELSGLDKEVQRLCDAAMALSEKERATYAGKLQKLLGDLTGLGQELTEYKDSMADEIRKLSTHRQASVAYRKTDASDDFGKKKKKKEEE